METFSRKRDKEQERTEKKVEALRSRLSYKDGVITELLEDNLRLKKKRWGLLSGCWVEPDVRDDVITWLSYWSKRTEMNLRSLRQMTGISNSTFYHWKDHYSSERADSRPFGGWWGITAEEEEAIVNYRKSHEFEGYRRLCYQMLDANVVAVSPAKVYRVLKRHDLLTKWNRKENRREGRGFDQPVKPHQHWHVDISYVKVCSTFFFLISVLDGFSRYIVHSELRTHMEEYDVEMVIQRALESFTGERPRIISDNGSQFISRDFKEFLGHKELTHVRTSVRYPQSNGKIERFHKYHQTGVRPKEKLVEPERCPENH